MKVEEKIQVVVSAENMEMQKNMKKKEKKIKKKEEVKVVPVEIFHEKVS